MTQSPAPVEPKDAKRQPDTREALRATALRANLQKRKAQLRARMTDTDSETEKESS
jgi:hypothetical protein